MTGFNKKCKNGLKWVNKQHSDGERVLLNMVGVDVAAHIHSFNSKH